MIDKVKDIVTKGVEIASPVPLPTRENRRKIKSITRKTNKFLEKKFPEATKKLIEFDKKVKQMFTWKKIFQKQKNLLKKVLKI
jgi:hypothetical protein